MSAAAVVEAGGVARRYPGGRGVGPVDLTLEAGETVGLMGHNGAGKTTLLRLCATLDRPQGGRLHWWGDASPVRARARLGVALDEPGEEETLSGRQAAHFWCRQWVSDGARARRLVDAALERFGLGAVADEPVGAYSYGMRRRLALVACLAHEPDLALLDEPTAGLDPDGTRVLVDALEERSAAGRSTLVASNDATFAARAFDRTGFLSAGAMVRLGATAGLLGEAGEATLVDVELDGPPGAPPPTGAGIEAVRATAAGFEVVLGDPGALPRLVGLVDTPPGRLRALRVRRADLGDVYRRLTGGSLEAPR